MTMDLTGRASRPLSGAEFILPHIDLDDPTYISFILDNNIPRINRLSSSSLAFDFLEIS